MAAIGSLSRARTVEEGGRFKLWVVGKYDESTRQDVNECYPTALFPAEGTIM